MKNSFFLKIKNFWINYEPIQKIIFKNKIDQISKSWLRLYFLDFFKLKIILIKVFFLLLFSIIVLPACFGVRNLYLYNYPQLVILNYGVGFSFGQHLDSSYIYLIQSIPVAISFVFIVFSNNLLTIFSFCIVFWSGLTNIIDRSMNDILSTTIQTSNQIPVSNTKDGVVDYWKLLNSSVCNLADIFICTGIGFVILSFLISIIKLFKEDKKNNIKTDYDEDLLEK